jgi:hypothetical protein
MSETLWVQETMTYEDVTPEAVTYENVTPEAVTYVSPAISCVGE